VLRALGVRDFAIAERVELELGPGFTALTGETGAGKSILVDAIELLVGGRGDAAVVRPGAERAELAAEFGVEKGSEIEKYLEENEFQGDPGVLLLRRTIDASGRSRGFVNGHSATLAQLKELGEFLVDIHGQHAHQSLLRAAAQRELLDAHAGAAGLARETTDSYRTWQRLEALAAEAEQQFARREAERAELEEHARELKRLAPREGEWDALAAEHARLAHGASLLEGAQAALDALGEAEDASLPRLGTVAGRLRALQAHDAQLAPIVDLLEAAAAQGGEALRALRQYASRVDLDPAALRQAEARIEALHAAARKHRTRPQELPGFLETVLAKLRELELSANPEALRRELAAARAAYGAAAAKLSAARKRAAAEFSRAVGAEMQKLAMPGGKFAAVLHALEAPAASGLEAVEFEVASHASLPLRPLAKVASGGELSRISLAVQGVAMRASPVATLVFDEVDAGIGGAVAETVGRSLARLGRERQVLCVTHLPQVAAQADQQWLVTRGGAKGKVSCAAARLDRAGRIEELARMLGGAAITATTRRHAAELLGAR